MNVSEAEAGNGSVMTPRGNYFEDFIPGRIYTAGRRTVSEADHVNFTTSFGFFEPLFMDQEYVARETPYGRPIVPGALTFSLAEGLTCFVGVISYLFVSHQGIQWNLAPSLALGALLSVPLAAYSVKRFRTSKLRLAVGIATVILGFVTLGKLFL